MKLFFEDREVDIYDYKGVPCVWGPDIGADGGHCSGTTCLQADEDCGHIPVYYARNYNGVDTNETILNKIKKRIQYGLLF